ncbi:hypothetical protein RJ640_016831 [Escallonia rubra]|uniref:Reverse transcriptase Ty1/copia-type domain-containing protein n=1 Tax=Escallonia rubra TaxID=112253 RepID=A0AA88UNK0_9ASTE|nr:hypothetical protein RJ640_016831 [Escallonia rubra]
MEERNNFATAEEKNVEDVIFLTYRGNEECRKNVWYLDTGASNHMSGLKELFMDLDETIKGEVTFGDSSKIPVKGKGMFNNFKIAMTKEFEMTDIGEMSYFLGVEVKQMEDGIFMSQRKYAEQILSQFRMKDCNPVAIPVETGVELRIDSNRKSVNPTLYKSMVESLRYLTFTQPNITYAVGSVNRYTERPKQDHFNAAKRILRYVRGTSCWILAFDRLSEESKAGRIAKE